jgi:hypothetical protein
MVILHLKGARDPFLMRNMTLKPSFKKYSAERAPLLPVLKFSIDLTVFFSSGTLVPPLVIKAKGSSGAIFRNSVRFYTFRLG